MKNRRTTIPALALVCLLIPSIGRGQDLNMLLDPGVSLPDYSFDTSSGKVTDKKTLETMREKAIAQFTEGQCSPTIANVSGSITIYCPVIKDIEKEGSFGIERVTKLIPNNENDQSTSFDILIANMRSADVWVKRFTIVGLGVSNNGCNPNPVPTFRYNVHIDVGKETLAKVSESGDSLSLPAIAKIDGSMEHEYCDGYLLISYEQSVQIPKKSKISYVLSIDKINFLAGKTISNGGIKSGVEVPRLGLTIDQADAIGGPLGGASFGKDLPPKDVFVRRGPNYLLPIWSNWFVFIQLDSGAVVAGKTEFTTSQSEFTKSGTKEFDKTSLFRELSAVGIPDEAATRLFNAYWRIR